MVSKIGKMMFVVLFLIISSCDKIYNANCEVYAKGIICRNADSEEVICFAIFEKENIKSFANLSVHLDGVPVAFEVLRDLDSLVNSFECGGDSYGWGPVSLGQWPEGTIKLVFSDFYLWYNNGEVVGVLCFGRYFKDSQEILIAINGNYLNRTSSQGLEKFLGEFVESKPYYSEY